MEVEICKGQLQCCYYFSTCSPSSSHSTYNQALINRRSCQAVRKIVSVYFLVQCRFYLFRCFQCGSNRAGLFDLSRPIPTSNFINFSTDLRWWSLVSLVLRGMGPSRFSFTIFFHRQNQYCNQIFIIYLLKLHLNFSPSLDPLRCLNRQSTISTWLFFDAALPLTR